MATVAKSLRIEASLAARVKALKNEEETESKAYMRVIAAGCEAIESGVEPDMEKAKEPPKEEAAQDVDSQLLQAKCDSLEQRITEYKDEISFLKDQIKTKDEQIGASTNLMSQITNRLEEANKLNQAEKLIQAGDKGLLPTGSSTIDTKPIEEEPEKKRGFWSRLWS